MRHLKYFENVNSKIELLKDILQEISDEQEFININVFDYSDKNGEAYNIIIG